MVLISKFEKSPERSWSVLGIRSEVSHHRGDVSGESLVCIGESPIVDELSGDGIGCYGAHQ